MRYFYYNWQRASACIAALSTLDNLILRQNPGYPNPSKKSQEKYLLLMQIVQVFSGHRLSIPQELLTCFTLKYLHKTTFDNLNCNHRGKFR